MNYTHLIGKNFKFTPAVTSRLIGIKGIIVGFERNIIYLMSEKEEQQNLDVIKKHTKGFLYQYTINADSIGTYLEIIGDEAKESPEDFMNMMY